MIEKSRILDDMAALAGGAASLVSAARQQICQDLRCRVDSLAARLDLVPREDFERLEALLVHARQEQEAMKKRLDAMAGGQEGAEPPRKTRENEKDKAGVAASATDSKPKPKTAQKTVKPRGAAAGRSSSLRKKSS